MKTLGFIGGTSWCTSMVYYRWIHELAGKQIGTQDIPSIIIHSIHIEVMRDQNPDRINVVLICVAK